MAPATPPLVLVRSRMQTGATTTPRLGRQRALASPRTVTLLQSARACLVRTVFLARWTRLLYRQHLRCAGRRRDCRCCDRRCQWKVGTVAMAANGTKMTVPGFPGANLPQAVPQRVQPRAFGPDPRQAMLNRKVEKQQATIAELKSTIAQQQKQLEKQQKQMEIFTAQLKAQAGQIQRVSAQIQLNKPAPRTVANGD